MNFHRLNLDKESNEAVINALKDALHANFAEVIRFDEFNFFPMKMKMLQYL